MWENGFLHDRKREGLSEIRRRERGRERERERTRERVRKIGKWDRMGQLAVPLFIY